MGLRVLITGATGFLGGGVLQECLANESISSIVSISRSSVNISSSKLEEIILPDFNDLSSLEEIPGGFDACFYCLGTSSNGLSEDEYRRVTIDISISFAKKILKINPDIAFTFISAEGSDINGKAMWARIKGKAEQEILELGFKHVFIFRPAVTYPDSNIEIRSKMNRYALYIIKPIYPLLKILFPNMVTTTSKFGKAMIHVVTAGFENRILGCKEINQINKENII